MTDSARTAPGSWWIDLAIAVALFVGLLLLRPALPDGDGLGYAYLAIHRSLLTAMETKHILYAPLLRCVLLLLEWFGLRLYALEAFTVVSNLAGVALYLLLARAVYAPLLRDLLLARLCALGTLLSYGVFSECCTIETYALALALAVALGARCVQGLTTVAHGAAAGLLFVLAVSIHITNVVTLPFVLALFWQDGRRRGWSAFLAFAGVVTAGAVVLAAALVFGAEGGPDWRRLIPSGEKQLSLGVVGHLSRAVYGMARTVAWLPPVWELTATLAIVYGVVFLLALALIVLVARRGFVRNLGNYRAAFLPLALLALPFTALGIYYFPSNPERWLFLMPALWLIVGRIWADDAPRASAWLSRPTARLLLAALVAVLGVYNAAYKLWPEAQHDRTKEGLEEFARLAGPDDLVVSLGQFHLLDEFVLRRPPFAFENLDLEGLMKKHGDRPENIAACRQDLRQRINVALRQGKRVLVYGLLGDENHVAGRGYPWAHVHYQPAELLDVLKEFRPEELVKADRQHTGTWQLHRP